jgi:N-acetylglucosamine kinase-like BadF-type ATPase
MSCVVLTSRFLFGSDALVQSKRGPREVASVCLGLAGVDRQQDVEKLTAMVQHWFSPTTRVIVHNDAVAALASGTQGQLYGCVLIAGTGRGRQRSMACRLRCQDTLVANGWS